MNQPTSMSDDVPRSVLLSHAFFLVGPFALLGLEVIQLTPQVEFHSGMMRILASPALFSSVFFSLTLFMLLSGRCLLDILGTDSCRHWWRDHACWLIINISAFTTLYYLTLVLDKRAVLEPTAWWQAVGWLSLVIAVGISAWLSFIPEPFLLKWIGRSWHHAVVATGLAVAFVTAIPWIQLLWLGWDPLWTRLHIPTVATSRLLLISGGHNEIIFYLNTGNCPQNPVLGNQGAGTPQEITQ
ncbi:MAG: hypothetical protein N2C12_04890, partial [Planctomycetales bacterium]